MRDLDAIVAKYKEALRTIPKEEKAEMDAKIHKMRGGSVKFSDYLNAFASNYFYLESPMLRKKQTELDETELDWISTVQCIDREYTISSFFDSDLKVLETINCESASIKTLDVTSTSRRFGWPWFSNSQMSRKKRLRRAYA